MALYVLYEHAAGYTLFRVKEFEEVGMHLPQVEQSVKNLSKFSSVVQLIAFLPFKNAANALDNINSVSEGILHQDLQLFLETNLPKPSKKMPVTVGVGDAKIGAAIQETLSYPCQHSGVVPEILRGIRLYFPSLVKGLTEQAASKAQLGLGHSYSRAKVKFNINRNDNMIIQSISLLDQLDKDINIFAMRVREWYSYHFPELIKIVPDNYMYAKVTKFIKNRKDLTEEKLDELEELVMDSTKARAIIDAAKASMGMDISPIDLINIETFASRVIALAEYRKELMEYLKTKMGNVAPNLATLIGETVGARLISHAGSLTNLAKYPSSTIQILGAEKALFRALKTRGNTPKYGLLFHSTFIGRAGAKHKGRISRYLANKCAIASRIDCFTETPNSVFGTKLREQVEERLKFFETGELPRKNIDVMKDAMEEAAIVIKKIKKKKKKEKKRKLEEQSSLMSSAMENSIADENESQEIADGELTPKKQKKKRKLKEESSIISSGVDDTVAYGNESQEISNEELSTKKQKKKRKLEEQSSFMSSGVDNIIADENESQEIADGELAPKKKKKKRKLKEESYVISSAMDDSVAHGNESQEVANKELSTKKQKRKQEEQSSFFSSGVDDSIANGDNSHEIHNEEASAKKKKKKKKKEQDLA